MLGEYGGGGFEDGRENIGEHQVEVVAREELEAGFALETPELAMGVDYAVALECQTERLVMWKGCKYRKGPMIASERIRL